MWRCPTARPTSPAAAACSGKSTARSSPPRSACSIPRSSCRASSSAGSAPTRRRSAPPAPTAPSPSCGGSSATSRPASIGPTNCSPAPSSRCDRRGGRCSPGCARSGIPDDPLTALWRRGDMLREYRGDSHIAAWVSAGVDATEIGLLTELYWGLPLRSYARTTGLDGRSSSTPRPSASSPVACSPTAPSRRPGASCGRASSRKPTCRCAPAIDALGDDIDELIAILAPWGVAIRDAKGYPPTHDPARTTWRSATVRGSVRLDDAPGGRAGSVLVDGARPVAGRAEPARTDDGVRVHRVERRRRRRLVRRPGAGRAVGRHGDRRDRPRAVHRLRHHPPARPDQRRAPLDRLADGGAVVGIGSGRRRAARARDPSRRCAGSCSAPSSSASPSDSARGCPSASAPCSPTCRTPGRCRSSARPAIPSLMDRFELQRSRYEGPTGIVGVLHDAMATAGIPVASLWAAVPQYAAQVPSPKAALALVERACGLIGSPAPADAFTGAAAEYDARIAALIADDDDLVAYVSRLESFLDDELDDGDDEDTGRPAARCREPRRARRRGRAVPPRPRSGVVAPTGARSANGRRRRRSGTPRRGSRRTPSAPTTRRRRSPAGGRPR